MKLTVSDQVRLPLRLPQLFTLRTDVEQRLSQGYDQSRKLLHNGREISP
jgi:hypothetical protein